MTEFTPFSALIGGLLIGTATVAFLWLTGRIAGISGIVGGLLSAAPQDWAWRLAFILGLVAAPFAYLLVMGEMPKAVIPGSMVTMAVAGFLVGFGTRLGSGCTSGHGICGVSRLSPRSLVATAAFMVSGLVTYYVLHHLLG